MSTNLITPAPNLPLPQEAFSQEYLNILTKVLRIYFNGNNDTVTTSVNDINTLTTLNWLNM